MQLKLKIIHELHLPADACMTKKASRYNRTFPEPIVDTILNPSQVFALKFSQISLWTLALKNKNQKYILNSIHSFR